VAGGGAVAALHVIGVDEQAGLTVHLGLFRQQEVFIGLLGVGLLGVLANGYVAAEDRSRLPVQDALVEQPAGAVRFGVVDVEVVIDVLAALGQL